MVRHVNADHGQICGWIIADRVRSGSVTDFVKLPLGWPPFNLADASITIGILVLFIVIDRSREREPAEHDPQGAGAERQGGHRR